MIRTIAEFEAQDWANLIALKQHTDFQSTFSVSAIQRALCIGYNRAARLIEKGLEAGILCKPKESYLLSFKCHYINQPANSFKSS